MSRDFTPKESWAFERWSIANGHGDKWDFLANTKMHYNGEEWPLCTAEELEIRKQFPYIGKLIENFQELHDALNKLEGGLDLLRKKDEELALYIEKGKGSRDSYLVLWFEGELDPNFYYAENNHKLFCDSLIAEAAAVGNN